MYFTRLAFWDRSQWPLTIVEFDSSNCKSTTWEQSSTKVNLNSTRHWTAICKELILSSPHWSARNARQPGEQPPLVGHWRLAGLFRWQRARSESEPTLDDAVPSRQVHGSTADAPFRPELTQLRCGAEYAQQFCQFNSVVLELVDSVLYW